MMQLKPQSNVNDFAVILSIWEIAQEMALLSFAYSTEHYTYAMYFLQISLFIWWSAKIWK